MLHVADTKRLHQERSGTRGDDLKALREAAGRVIEDHRAGRITSEQAAEELRKLSSARRTWIDWLFDI